MNNEETHQIQEIPIADKDQTDDLIKTKTQELHLLATQVQIDMIKGITSEEGYNKDPKTLRLLNEVIANANTNSLATKKLGIDEKSDNTNKMLVALALSMARKEGNTIDTLSGLASTRTTDFVPPTIHSDKVFDPGTLEQGLRPITFEEVFKDN